MLRIGVLLLMVMVVSCLYLSGSVAAAATADADEIILAWSRCMHAMSMFDVVYVMNACNT